ncbi:MAG: hypothetical protein HOE48_20255 [Candidatus Latescibacteria bacterium]|jgi:hypothetical protein|nr:hypothetical protein [Candidatus Latescibacterota bacterium]
MREEFIIDGVCYVINFTKDHHLHFHADVHKSTKEVYKSDGFSFWDEPPERIWTTTSTGNAFKIKRKVLKFLENALRRYSPYYFTFSAIEKKRLPLYEKLARRIGKKYGYDLTQDYGSFRFTRCFS